MIKTDEAGIFLIGSSFGLYVVKSPQEKSLVPISKPLEKKHIWCMAYIKD